MGDRMVGLVGPRFDLDSLRKVLIDECVDIDNAGEGGTGWVVSVYEDAGLTWVEFDYGMAFPVHFDTRITIKPRVMEP